MIDLQKRMAQFNRRVPTMANAQAIVDGAILSDANVQMNGKGAQFRIMQEGIRHLDWLELLRYSLEALGIAVCDGHPKLHTRTTRGKCRTYYYLVSTNSRYMVQQRNRWYVNGFKEVPGDFILTPVSLANWFMGDGTSAYNNSKCVVVRFATHSFNEQSIEILDSQLGRLGILTTKWGREPSGIVLSLRQESVNKFMDMIEPHTVSSFTYKIKRRV